MAKKKKFFEERLKEGNWTALFNEVLEPALKSDLTLNELRVFLYICRMTWGWRKDSEVIRVRDIVKELGLDKKNASIALSSLKNKHFVVKSPTNRCQIQMDTSKWRIDKKSKVGKKDNFVGKSPTKRGQFVGKSPTLVGKTPTTNSQDSPKNANRQGPKDTTPKTKRKTTSRARKPPDDVSPFNLLKPKTIQTLIKDPFRVGKKELTRLLAMTEEQDTDTFFFDWIEHILSDPSIEKPGGYFITAIKRGSSAPPPLYLTRRVELFNDFTGNEFRAEKNTAFENRLERRVLEKAKERIKEIPFIYNFKGQIERAKDPEIKLRYQQREEEERQKAKIKLVHHICSIIKPSRLKMFRKKLLKVDPGNPNFKQAIARGYELHTKRPYGEQRDERVV